jgi:hypothetical protein
MLLAPSALPPFSALSPFPAFDSVPPGRGQIPTISISGSSYLRIVCDRRALVLDSLNQMTSTLGLAALELSILPVTCLGRSVL